MVFTNSRHSLQWGHFTYLGGEQPVVTYSWALLSFMMHVCIGSYVHGTSLNAVMFMCHQLLSTCGPSQLHALPSVWPTLWVPSVPGPDSSLVQLLLGSVSFIFSHYHVSNMSSSQWRRGNPTEISWQLIIWYNANSSNTLPQKYTGYRFSNCMVRMWDMSAGSLIIYLVRDPGGLSHSSAFPW